ncbi:MAG: phosphoribosylglycinamide formyltransferase [Eubacterium sp.]|nr:phosphoribosylglycinamide formyltransferase [Eubacterium sp.]
MAKKETVRISVLVSGGGSNLQSLIDAQEAGNLANAQIVQVISSSHKAYGIERAKNHNIPAKVISKQEYADMNERMLAVLDALNEAETDLVVLAGYLSILSSEVIKAYEGRIINIHPSLLPKFGGKDCYGIKVHEKVIEAKETESGPTVHFVDEGIDTGKIILQRKVEVLPEDTPEDLQKRVLVQEHIILPEAVRMVIEQKGW